MPGKKDGGNSFVSQGSGVIFFDSVEVLKTTATALGYVHLCMIGFLLTFSRKTMKLSPILAPHHQESHPLQEDRTNTSPTSFMDQGFYRGKNGSTDSSSLSSNGLSRTIFWVTRLLDWSESQVFESGDHSLKSVEEFLGQQKSVITAVLTAAFRHWGILASSEDDWTSGSIFERSPEVIRPGSARDDRKWSAPVVHRISDISVAGWCRDPHSRYLGWVSYVRIVMLAIRQLMPLWKRSEGTTIQYEGTVMPSRSYFNNASSKLKVRARFS